jgi:SEC-C motif domain protein
MATAQDCDQKMVQLSTCPCGLPVDYAACCERYLRGAEHLRAPTAEALMRSRYSAYVARDAAYLLATWHASTRPRRIEFPLGLRWLGLTVVRHEQLDADHAVVEFVAQSEVRRSILRLRRADTRTPSNTQIMHEVSRFVRLADRWYYLDGVVS